MLIPRHGFGSLAVLFQVRNRLSISPEAKKRKAADSRHFGLLVWFGIAHEFRRQQNNLLEFLLGKIDLRHIKASGDAIFAALTQA